MLCLQCISYIETCVVPTCQYTYIYVYNYVTKAKPSHSKPRQWKSMLIHQGWFTVLYTQHLLDSQNFEFEICILQALNMPLIRCTNVYFFQGRLSRHITSPSEKTRPESWPRDYMGKASCHHPTAATKCKESRTKPQQTPSVEKHAHPPRVVYCAIYSTLTRFTKFRV